MDEELKSSVLTSKKNIRELKIYDATTRRRVIKSKQILIEDNNYK